MQDDVFGAEKRTDGTDIGGMAANKDHAVIHTVEAGKGLFQLTLHRPFTGHQTAGPG